MKPKKFFACIVTLFFLSNTSARSISADKSETSTDNKVSSNGSGTIEEQIRDKIGQQAEKVNEIIRLIDENITKKVKAQEDKINDLLKVHKYEAALESITIFKDNLYKASKARTLDENKDGSGLNALSSCSCSQNLPAEPSYKERTSEGIAELVNESPFPRAENERSIAVTESSTDADEIRFVHSVNNVAKVSTVSQGASNDSVIKNNELSSTNAQQTSQNLRTNDEGQIKKVTDSIADAEIKFVPSVDDASKASTVNEDVSNNSVQKKNEVSLTDDQQTGQNLRINDEGPKNEGEKIAVTDSTADANDIRFVHSPVNKSLIGNENFIVDTSSAINSQLKNSMININNKLSHRAEEIEEKIKNVYAELARENLIVSSKKESKSSVSSSFEHEQGEIVDSSNAENSNLSQNSEPKKDYASNSHVSTQQGITSSETSSQRVATDESSSGDLQKNHGSDTLVFVQKDGKGMDSNAKSQIQDDSQGSQITQNTLEFVQKKGGGNDSNEKSRIYGNENRGNQKSQDNIVITETEIFKNEENTKKSDKQKLNDKSSKMTKFQIEKKKDDSKKTENSENFESTQKVDEANSSKQSSKSSTNFESSESDSKEKSDEGSSITYKKKKSLENEKESTLKNNEQNSNSDNFDTSINIGVDESVRESESVKENQKIDVRNMKQATVAQKESASALEISGSSHTSKNSVEKSDDSNKESADAFEARGDSNASKIASETSEENYDSKSSDEVNSNSQIYVQSEKSSLVKKKFDSASENTSSNQSELKNERKKMSKSDLENVKTSSSEITQNSSDKELNAQKSKQTNYDENKKTNGAEIFTENKNESLTQLNLQKNETNDSDNTVNKPTVKKNKGIDHLSLFNTGFKKRPIVQMHVVDAKNDVIFENDGFLPSTKTHAPGNTFNGFHEIREKIVQHIIPHFVHHNNPISLLHAGVRRPLVQMHIGNSDRFVTARKIIKVPIRRNVGSHQVQLAGEPTIFLEPKVVPVHVPTNRFIKSRIPNRIVGSHGVIKAKVVDH